MRFRDLVEDLVKDQPDDAHKQAWCILYTGSLFTEKHLIVFRAC